MKLIELIRSKRPFNNICLGGTFDHLHDGHKLLLKTAFKLGNNVYIGLTMDSLTKYKRYYKQIQSFRERKENLEGYIHTHLNKGKNTYKITPLSDPYGPVLEITELEALICSSESYRRCIKVNRLRKKKNLKPATIIIIPIYKNKMGKKLSSTDIRAELSIIKVDCK